MVDNIIGFHPGLALFMLRVVLGVIFIPHGIPKLFGTNGGGPQEFARALAGMKVPAPLLSAYLVGTVELLGGVLLIAGFLTRLAALFLVINMLVAIWLVKRRTGLVTNVQEGGWVGGFELDLALAAGCAALVLMGAGKFSIDYLILTAQ